MFNDKTTVHQFSLLTYVTLQFVGATFYIQGLKAKGTDQSSVACGLSKQVFEAFFYVARTVPSVVYLHILEGFLMSFAFLEKGGHINMLVQQDSPLLHFCTVVQYLLHCRSAQKWLPCHLAISLPWLAPLYAYCEKCPVSVPVSVSWECIDYIHVQDRRTTQMNCNSKSLQLLELQLHRCSVVCGMPSFG